MTEPAEPADEPSETREPERASEAALPLEHAWPLAVVAGAVGSALGLLVGWPAFPAAFAAVALWVVERRAGLAGRHRDTALVTLGWLAAVILVTGSVALYFGAETIEPALPGVPELTRLAGERPWLVLAGAVLVALTAAFGARWANGSFAHWVFGLAGCYVAAVAGERVAVEGSGVAAAIEAGPVEALLLALPFGPLFAIVGGVLIRGFRDSGDRRFLSAAIGALVLAVAGSVLS
ncbi:MAG: hypothetical protein WD226_13870 [Planctomycetota bacterium]